jgi:hypothetical protein
MVDVLKKDNDVHTPYGRVTSEWLNWCLEKDNCMMASV